MDRRHPRRTVSAAPLAQAALPLAVFAVVAITKKSVRVWLVLQLIARDRPEKN